MIHPSGEQYGLSFQAQRATIVEVGGGLRTYEVGEREVLDGYGVDELCRSGRGQVLAPWPNRVAGGVYSFDGEEHRLALTEPTAGNAIHGLARWACWRAAEKEPERVVMEHVLHPQPGYPFTLRLRVEYRLVTPDERARKVWLGSPTLLLTAQGHLEPISDALL